MKITIKKTSQILCALFLISAMLSVGAQSPSSKTKAVYTNDEVSIAALRAKKFTAQLTFEKHLYNRLQYSADLYSYLSDGLIVFALINTPTTDMPSKGFPVIIFGHGFHPEPEKYGVSSDGVVSRPGDYYRGIPERYASEGYVVITPDYRGHNISQGAEYTKRDSLSSSYYASDVLHLLSAIDGIKLANAEEIYYAGHSMGGDVGLKMLLATNKIRAASLWSPAVGSTAQKALYYGRYYDEDKNAKVDAQKIKKYRSKIDRVYAQFAASVSEVDADAINHLNYLTTPLIIHHARGDRSVPYLWSENLVLKLNKFGKDFSLYSYDTDNHLFEGSNLESAFMRDLAFFDKH